VNLFLDSAASDQTDDLNIAGLTDTMGAVLSLDVILGIKTRVKDDDFVGTCQIDTSTAGFCTEHEYRDGGVIGELIDDVLTGCHGSTSVETHEFDGQCLKDCFQDVHHCRKLREDECAIAILDVPPSNSLSLLILPLFIHSLLRRVYLSKKSYC